MKTAQNTKRRRETVYLRNACIALSSSAIFQLSSCSLYGPLDEISEPAAAMAQSAEESAVLEGKDWKPIATQASIDGRMMFQDGLPGTLDETTAVRIALSNALEMELSQIAVLDAHANSDLAHSALTPSIVGLFDIGDDGESLPSNVSNPGSNAVGAGMYVRQDILTWGAHRRRISAAHEMEGREEALRDMLKNDTAAATHLAFANLRRIAATRAACAEAIGGFKILYKQAEERVGADIEAGASLTDIESRLAGLNAQKAMIDLEDEDTRNILWKMLGVPATTAFKLYPAAELTCSADEIKSVDELIADTQGHRPDISALEREARAAGHEIAARKADRLPKFSVSAGGRTETNTDFDTDQSEFSAGVRSRWIPFDGGGHKAKIELAKNRLAAAHTKLEHAREAANTEVRSGYSSYQKSKIARSATTKAVQLAKDSLKLATEQQGTARLSTDSLLNTQERVFRATVQDTVASFAERRSAIQLKRSLGEFINARRGKRSLEDFVPKATQVAK
jgi:outer membrane protein TolC